MLGNSLALVALLALFWELRTLVSWLLAAVILALAAEPPVQWLVRHRFKRGLAVLVVCLAFAAAVAGLIATLVPMVVEQGRALIAAAPELLERLRETTVVRWIDERVHVIERVREGLVETGTQSAGAALSVAGTILFGIVGAISVVAFAVFAMLFGGELVRGGLSWLPPSRRPRVEELAGRMQQVVGRYVLGTVLVAAIGGTVMSVTTLILGVPYYLALGLVMLVLGLIPFLGSAIGAVLVVGITFSTVGLQGGIIAAVVYLIYQQVENEVLQPVVQRRTMRMNPLVISVALLAGTMLAGVIGALLALPIAGALQVIAQDVQARRAVRWAPPPPPSDERTEPTGEPAEHSGPTGEPAEHSGPDEHAGP